MKKFLMNMLSNQLGEVSTKRVIGFSGFIFLVTVLFISALSKRVITPAASLVDAVSYITIAALFGNTAEKFAKGNNPPSE